MIWLAVLRKGFMAESTGELSLTGTGISQGMYCYIFLSEDTETKEVKPCIQSQHICGVRGEL